MQAPTPAYMTDVLSVQAQADMSVERQLEILLYKYKTRLYRFLACADSDAINEVGPWGEIMIEHDTANAIMALFSDR